MADVKIKYEEYAAFPTMIYKFHPDLANDLHFNMAAYIRAQKGTQTEDDIYKLSTNTYVEESEESKKRTAGAGLTDND